MPFIFGVIYSIEAHPKFLNVMQSQEAGMGMLAPQVRELIWSSSFHLQHRIATQVFNYRTLLCGDAAHVHSPAGGQGTNIGIQDAVALAAPLAHAVRHGGTEGLAAWAAQRHEVASEVIRMTDAMTWAATLSSPLARALRDAALGIAGNIPFVRRKLATRLAELGN